MLTGIGGQSVQLAARILARAATLEERHVMLLGSYGGTMRGGNTDATLLVADEPISAPPIVARTGSALAMHHAFWEPLRKKLRPRAVVILNSTLFEGAVDREAQCVFDVPATRIATELGNPLAGALVLIGAYAGLTDLVGVDSLVRAMRESVPAYRRQHVADNEKALRAGFASLEANAAPAWRDAGASA